MKIRGAVLDQIGAPPRYAESAPLTITELELAPPGDTELLVRIEAAGLCHSDLSVVNGSRVRPVPMLLGHEAAGIVEQVGAAVGDLAVGQRVVMTFLPDVANARPAPPTASPPVFPAARPTPRASSWPAARD